MNKYDEQNFDDFQGYHSEWNLASPDGWDYQRLTQRIGKAVWQKLDKFINIEEEELEIAQMNPWEDTAAVMASDDLFNFGAADDA
jgi:hypothetical protein